jgi:hypothetical protein
MKEYKKLLYIFMMVFLVSGCKILEKKATEIKNSFGIQSSEESIKKENSIEITNRTNASAVGRRMLKN